MPEKLLFEYYSGDEFEGTDEIASIEYESKTQFILDFVYKIDQKIMELHEVELNHVNHGDILAVEASLKSSKKPKLNYNFTFAGHSFDVRGFCHFRSNNAYGRFIDRPAIQTIGDNVYTLDEFFEKHKPVVDD